MELTAPVKKHRSDLLRAVVRGELNIEQTNARIPHNGHRIAPLSYPQTLLWFMDQFEPGSPAYNIPSALRMVGPLNVNALNRAVQEIVRRHEILRTTYHLIDGSPIQRIEDPMHLPLPVVDLTQLDEFERKSESLQMINEEAQRPFDLENGPLFRSSLLRLGEEEHILMMTMHHISSDGWSRKVLTNDLHSLYNSFADDELPSLPELPIQYADYAVWQREWLQGEVLDSQMAYWKQHLAEAPTVLELPTDRPRPQVQSFRGAIKQAELPSQLLTSLKALGNSNGATLFMMLLAVFEVLLYRYSGQDDIIVGTPIANRTRPETKNLIGFFINTLALRGDLSGDPTFVELLARVREAALAAYANQDLPFEKLVEELQPERSMSHSPIFQVMFGFQTASAGVERMNNVRIQSIGAEKVSAKFDILLMVSESNGRLGVVVEYNTDLFNTERIEKMLGHYQTLLEGIVADPTQQISDIPLLSEPERQQILVEWNDTATEYPRDRCIHTLFEDQAELTPDHVAVVFEEQSLTYRELNDRANRIASYLRQQGVGPEALVGLHVERSLEMIVGLLGILKAGGAYLPLDPSNPRERTASILETVGWPMLLSGADIADKLAGLPCPIVCLDDELLLSQSSDNTAVPNLAGDNLAYVMFTSGSTGRPKGVAVAHRAVLRLVKGMRYCNLGPDEVIFQLAPLAFDASTFDIWGCLLNGGRLVLFPGSTPAPDDIGRILRQENVTTVFMTTGLFNVMVEQQLDAFEGVRQLLTGGEVASVATMNKLRRRVPTCRLIHCYGPTENTSFTSTYVVPFDVELAGPVPIGHPISNTQVYVLDKRMCPVPSGVFGELYTGGDGLSRGYLDRPELTAERFVPNPYSAEPGARLYSTGDIVRWRSDGQIEFQGRLDLQVKLRGFRIELGEIESALHAHHDVQDAVVVAREDTPGEKRLVAYLVIEKSSGLDPRSLRNYLKQSLPDYMVPAAFVELDLLPLTRNGKIDRKSLPAPEIIGSLVAAYQSPRNAVEEGLTEIWSDILHVPLIGIHDSFFELGGHSLLATQVVSRIRSVFGVDLPLRTFFETPTIAALAERLAEAQRENCVVAPPLTRVSRESSLPLSFAQQRLWFIQQMEPDSPAYNVPVALKVTALLDENALEQSLNEIVRRHEPLRTTFEAVDGVATQVVHKYTPYRLHIVDLSGLDEDARKLEANRLMEAEALRPFDIEQSVYRASMLRMGQEEYILLVTIHHIASDGWSLGVLITELKSLYKAFREGQPSPLPELAIQYVDFAAWQRSWLQGDALDRQLSYWRNQIAGAPELLELPSDRPRPAVQSYRCARRTITLPAKTVSELKALGHREGVTLFMTLLAAFQTMLYRYTGQEDMLIGSPIANRTRTELEGLIGFFVNMLMLRCDLSGDPSFKELLSRVRETTLAAYTHQDLPFERLVEELLPERSLSHTPLCQVTFALASASRSDTDADGLALKTIGAPGVRGKFDLQFFASENDSGLTLSALYSTDLFDDDRIERLLGHYGMLLRQVVCNPDQNISALTLLSDQERRQSLFDWNDTKIEFPDLRLHQLVESRVDRSPDATAVSFEGQSLSYRELDERANQLAHYLRSQGISSGAYIGVAMERSVELVVALLGVLKAGAAYIPIDPDYPQERVTAMLRDAGVPLIISQGHLAASLPRQAGVLICIDHDWTAISTYSCIRPNIEVDALDPAYVIYTSGSTGRAKGVVIPHRAIVNHMYWMDQTFPLSTDDRLLQKTPISFDASVLEFWAPLIAGAELVMAQSGAHRDPAYLVRTIKERRITMIVAVPSLLQMLLDEDGFSECKSLRWFICGGEALTRDIVDRFFSLFGSRVELHNLYGPTEAAIDATGFACDSGIRTPTAPIGRPISNTQLYVLDRDRQPAPVGVPGELYIGGDGLALGYVGRGELTAERFVPNPFSAEGGERLYKTDDLVKYLPDGNLEYLGRLDHQVKVRGFRIELGEIESVMVQHPAVREAVVLVREDNPGDRRLAAYIVAERAAVTALDEFRDAEAQQTSDRQAVFDAYYAEADPEQDPRFNIKGWDSSFTGLPIPAQDMAEWVDNTVERILELKPERVVEIGCGTGLLLFRIYPHCTEYIATDFSGEVIEYVRQVLASVSESTTHVNLQQKEANAFADIGEDAPDTVILNSVVQYLPSVDYLMEVLEKAVASVASGGRIFLGDIRSFAMLEEFQASVQLWQAGDDIERHRLWQRVKQASSEEDELLLDPAFFYALRERLPRVTRVDVQAKRGRHWNEMTCFRYDVVLHVGTEAPTPADASWRDWTREGMSISSLRSLLQEGPDIVAVTGIPNARTADAVLAHKMLAQHEDLQTVSEIRAAMTAQRIPSVDPEEIWTLGDEFPYLVRICPSGTRHRGCIDVLLRRRNSAEDLYFEFPGNSLDAGSAYASDQLRGRLIATFVPQLRRFLESRLPEYMVPAAFVLLDSLPHTPNGKVDRKALPAPDGTRPELESEYESPQTPAEITLAGIWADVLRIERVGIHDNFFELGGDSILSIQIIARANAAGLKLSPRQIFQQQTIAELARVAGTGATMHAQQSDLTGLVPLTPIQHWFFETYADQPHHFNQARLLTLREPIDPDYIERILKSLITHHDALRLRFTQTDSGWNQSYTPPDDSTVLERIDLTSIHRDQQGEAVTRECSRLQSSLNVQEGPLLRCAYFNMGDQKPARLFVVVHHLAVDGVSWRILLADLTKGLQQVMNSESMKLAPKTTSLQYWATRLLEHANSEPLRRQLDYWLSDARSWVRPLPMDHAGGANTRSSAQMVRVSLSEAQTRALLQDVPAIYHTQINDFLLTALAETLCSWTGEREVLVDLEGHGREPLFEEADLSRTTGWFTSMFPVLLDLSGSVDAGSRLKAIKEQQRAIPERGLGYGLLRYMCGEAEIRDALKEMPQAQVSFNYHGYLDQVIEDSGLFGVASEHRGDAASPIGVRSHILDVLSSISGGCLRVGWHYSANQYERATIERLASSYIEHLAQLIDHCQSADAGGFTPSDFPDADISQQDLDRLLEGILKK